MDSMESKLDLFHNISESVDSKTGLVFSHVTGLASDRPAISCSQIAHIYPNSTSGYYWIRSSTGSPVRLYCDFNRACGCDGPSVWTRVAFLNISDPNAVCPGNWVYFSSRGMRGCGRGRHSQPNYGGCRSVWYSTHGINYNRVCGRIIAHDVGLSSAFSPLIIHGLNVGQTYLNGISLTHGG